MRSQSKTESKMFLGYLASAALGDILVSTNIFFLPILAVEVGGDVLEVGVVGGASYAVYAFMPFVMGRYSDTFRSKYRLLLLSFSIIAMVSLVYAFASNPYELIAARLFEGIGWSMVWPVLQSGLVHLPGDKKRILSVYNSVWAATYASGPLIAGFLASLGSIRYVFYLTTLVAASGAILNLTFYNVETETEIETNNSEPDQRIELDQSSTPQNKGDLRRYFLAVVVAAMAVGTTLTFFGPYARSVGMPIFILGLVSAGYGFGRFVFFLLSVSGRFRSKILHPRFKDALIVCLLILISALCVSFLVGDRIGGISFLAFLAIGSSYAVVVTIVQAITVAEAPGSQTGAIAGMLESSVGIGTFFGPVLAGAVAKYLSISPFYVPIFPMIFFIIAFYFMKNKRRLEAKPTR
ncbi:MAG TPA: MFS transporter [Nitrososphaerales archaeon]|nr:MFS transporter [Nitrososphaerales archaeon]